MKKQKYFMVMYRPKGLTVFTPVYLTGDVSGNFFGKKSSAEKLAECLVSETPECEYSVFCLVEED